MSSHFSANQYESAFTSKSLANWEVPDTYKSRPVTLKGVTQVIADDKGHLRENVPRSAANPWGNFIGTWEMPEKIAGNQARVPTGRTSYAQQKLNEEARAAECVLTGTNKNMNRADRLGSSKGPKNRSVKLQNTGMHADDAHLMANMDEMVYQSPVPRYTTPPAEMVMTPQPSGRAITPADKPGTPYAEMARTPPPGSAYSVRRSAMGHGDVVTPPLPVRTPVTPKTPASFRSQQMPVDPTRMVSPATPELGFTVDIYKH